MKITKKLLLVVPVLLLVLCLQPSHAYAWCGNGYGWHYGWHGFWIPGYFSWRGFWVPGHFCR